MSEQAVALPVTHVSDAGWQEREDRVVNEEPLEIIVEGKPFAVVMRTPGEEIQHAAGLLLAEGLIEKRSDLATVEYCGSVDANRILAKLADPSRVKVEAFAERRAYLSQSSCGICGKEMLAEISQRIVPCKRTVQVSPQELFRMHDAMEASQVVRAATGGTHAMALFDAQGDVIAFAEDVGRHNAMDKVVGRALLAGRLEDCAVCIASSRASFEMAQKAASAGVPVLATVSAPTSLAIELAERAGMTLVCLLRGGSLRIFSGRERIRLEPV